MNKKTVNDLIDKAGEVYNQNFDNKTWFGRCIFLSWYCDLGTCEFCFRSTVKHKIKHAKSAKRSKASILTDAILGYKLGWRIEFLTGGYRIFSFEEMVEIARIVSEVYGYKIWVNMGVLDAEQLEMLRPYVEGICASIETVEKELHDKICPDKAIEPYSDMLKLAKSKGFKTSMTMVVGLGESKKDLDVLFKFIEEHSLDRITFYALKPVVGTRFTESPSPDDYSWWIAQTRIKFPKIEIIAGLTPKSACDYAGLILKAGANAITKFPVVKKFGSEDSKEIVRQVGESGREMVSELVNLPSGIDWDGEVDRLNIDDELKEQVKEKLGEYLKKMRF